MYFAFGLNTSASTGKWVLTKRRWVWASIAGSFRIRVDDGQTRRDYWLRDPRKGLYISRLIWREMDRFSQGAVCMVLASQPYDEADYYRNYEDFLAAVREQAT